MRARGFTLLEMLMVLVIGGLLVGLASLSLSHNTGSALLEQGQRLALAFETAGDEAQLRNAPISWEPVDGGYRFSVRDGARWRPLSDDVLGGARWMTAVSGVAIRYPGVSSAVKVLRFGTESIGDAASVTLFSDNGAVTISTNGDGQFLVRKGTR
ncbi:GspH/FimT family pseudopilin [Robbsia sp. KACC 23696]|uniref:GspH/FimT family pseudopilin n=1 Tax=Robbsia sp. KACC 23696 TaxID=3149231 RepID=UPI00325A9172